jgi:predicted negative regulator of RcsB-dependent stress response
MRPVLVGIIVLALLLGVFSVFSATTLSLDEEDRAEDRPKSVLSAAVAAVMLTFLVVFGAFGYRFYERRHLMKRAQLIKQRVQQQIANSRSIDNPDEIYDQVEEVEQAIRERNYVELEDDLDELDRMIS